MMERTRDRIERIVRVVLFTGGFMIFLVLAAAAISLGMVELCRFPVYELGEDFYYKIDVEYPTAGLSLLHPHFPPPPLSVIL